MEYELLIKSLQREYPDINIIAIFKAGSCSWECPTAHDQDFFVLVDNEWERGCRTLYKRMDIFIYPLKVCLTQIPWGASWPMLRALVTGNVEWGSIPCQMKWEEVKIRAIQEAYGWVLLSIAKILSPRLPIYLISKLQYYNWLIYFTAKKNGDFTLSEEERAQVQHIHDNNGGTLTELLELKENYEKYFSSIINN